MIDKITIFFKSLEPLTTKLVGALLILFIGFIIGRIVGVLFKRLLNGINTDKNIKRVIGIKLSIEKIVTQITSGLIYVTTVIMALNHLGVTTVILTIITAIIIIIFAISLLLAVRDLLPNLFAGFAIKYRGDFVVGQEIKVKGVQGVVSEINFLNTKVTSGDDLLVIPNSLFQKQGFQVKK